MHAVEPNCETSSVRFDAQRGQAIATVDPFTYAVHAFKSLLLKNTGMEAITTDLLYLLAFSIVAMTAATSLFRRTL